LVKHCKKGQRRQVAEADFRLHKCIVTLSGHRRLGEQYRLVEQQIRIYIASSDSLATDYQICIDHHRPIVDAILSGDAASAERLSAEHNISEGQKLVNLLEKQEHANATKRIAV
jgi:DNA-binding GntR family transcriptional regulator